MPHDEAAPDAGPAVPQVWILMGHKAGDNAQVLALAEALEWPFAVKHFVYRRYEVVPNMTLGATLAGIDAAQSSPLQAPWPDLVISAGRRNEPVARWIRSARRPTGSASVSFISAGRGAACAASI